MQLLNNQLPVHGFFLITIKIKSNLRDIAQSSLLIHRYIVIQNRSIDYVCHSISIVQQRKNNVVMVIKVSAYYRWCRCVLNGRVSANVGESTSWCGVPSSGSGDCIDDTPPTLHSWPKPDSYYYASIYNCPCFDMIHIVTNQFINKLKRVRERDES